MVSYGTLRVEHPYAGVTALFLDRPEHRNALDVDLTAALHEVFAGVGDDVVVLGTTDPQCFCAGGDLTIEDAARARMSDELYRLYGVMLATPGPIVAAVQGSAVGGGAQLALASDLRIGEASSWFRFAGVGHGLAVGAWGLPTLVGRGRALELCLTMRAVKTDEALAIGLLDRVEDDARTAALELAERLTTLDRGALARAKQVVATAVGLREALEEERAGNRASWSGSVAGIDRRREDAIT